MSANWLLLIPVAALVAIALGSFAVLRLQRATLRHADPRSATSPAGVNGAGFRQSPQESREDFVRRHRQRPGVVADGETLVDLYDRIRALEERVTAAEERTAAPERD
ncbi:hypothetical protein AB0C91_02815 [Streptomyces sp. NPDC048674]|uniref:hypothetical protein n=1 Tax=Streptomyces sp. NPDC048674 TaxID=3155491 RepID=UPI003417E04E